MGYKEAESTELLDLNLPHDDSSGKKYVDDVQKPEKRRLRGTSWKVTVAGGAAVAAAVCVLNITVFVWVKVQFPSSDSDGVTTVFSGSCDKAKRIELWVDLTINIVSTVLFAAGNQGAHLLSSPSRSDIDKAHARGNWMDIGVPSLRNLAQVPGWRVLLWILLYMSSIPLHLLYNSVVFNTLSANDYQAALVTHEFLTGGWWNETTVNYTLSLQPTGSSKSIAEDDSPGSHSVNYFYESEYNWMPPYFQQLHNMQNHVGTLQRLENAECVQAYGSSMFESTYRSVLVVSSNVNSSDNVLSVWLHSPMDVFNDKIWICNGNYNSDYISDSGTCDMASVVANSSQWTIHNVQRCESKQGGEYDCNPFAAKVDYCLAEYSPAPCTIRINTYILLVVIACNLIKALCLTLTVRTRDFYPLATIGDAIVSFLDRPEESTKSVGPLTIIDVKKRSSREARRRKGKPVPLLQFKRTRYRWARAVSIKKWCLYYFLSLGCFGVSLVWGMAQPQPWVKSALPQEVGSLQPDNIVIGMSHNLLATVLAANTPQAVISFTYLLYNHIFTIMMLAHEWGRFSQVRKALRVSRRVQGSAQRSTYWLHIPYRFILPMTALTAILHWVAARSLFVVQFTTYGITGKIVPGPWQNSCAWSGTAAFYGCILSAILIITLLVFSLLRLPPGMPLGGTCSLVVSAAAHAGDFEDDAALRPVMYGVLQRGSMDLSSEMGEGRVGFSSRAVLPWEKGKGYQVNYS